MNVRDSAYGYIERGKVSGISMTGVEGLFSTADSGKITLTDFNLIISGLHT